MRSDSAYNLVFPKCPVWILAVHTRGLHAEATGMDKLEVKHPADISPGLRHPSDLQHAAENPDIILGYFCYLEKKKNQTPLVLLG